MRGVERRYRTVGSNLDGYRIGNHARCLECVGATGKDDPSASTCDPGELEASARTKHCRSIESQQSVESTAAFECHRSRNSQSAALLLNKLPEKRCRAGDSARNSDMNRAPGATEPSGDIPPVKSLDTYVGIYPSIRSSPESNSRVGAEPA